jgi:membrane fusion protein (multidrug efflux system)
MAKRRVFLLRLVITLVGLGVLIGLPAYIKLQQFRTMAAAPQEQPPTTVTAAPVQRATWPRTVNAVGSLVAVQGVTVAAETGGKIVEIAFDSGKQVVKGDLLVRIDSDVEQAQLRSAQAAAELAAINLERNKGLRAKHSVSKADLDTADANYRQASAQVDNIRAVLAKKTVRAPFAGRLGLRMVNLGQILQEGDPIVPLQTIDPIYAEFSVPQQQLSLLAEGRDVRITTDAAPDQVFNGKITAVNPQIDAANRQVRVQATISNISGQLRPGMFANVEVLLPHAAEVLAIPQTAVLYAPYGDTVFVIEEQQDPSGGSTKKLLHQQIVRLGRRRGDYVAVESGLAEGESVVTSGVFKLRPHMEVVVDNALALNAQLTPNPANE